MIRSAKPNAWKVSTLRAWMPSAWPMASRPAAALDDAGGDVGELGELRGGEHAGGPGAHDEHVDLVGKLGGPVDADAGGRLDARVTGYVAVVVELHGIPHFVVWLGIAQVVVFYNRILRSIIENLVSVIQTRDCHGLRRHHKELVRPGNVTIDYRQSAVLRRSIRIRLAVLAELSRESMESWHRVIENSRTWLGGTAMCL